VDAITSRAGFTDIFRIRVLKGLAIVVGVAFVVVGAIA